VVYRWIEAKVRRVRALVTGGRGFVGTWLIAHLRAEGDQVVSIDREVEITDAAAVREAVTAAGPDALYHLAALTHVGRSWSDPGEVFRVNALGTLNVLEAARACARAPRVLITSSAEVYGTVTEDELPVLEQAPLAPVTPYGASKVAGCARPALQPRRPRTGLPVRRAVPRFAHRRGALFGCQEHPRRELGGAAGLDRRA
jgi:nucleoside-diphosphate-sugar epimerase